MLLQIALAALLAQAAPYPTPDETALMDRIERDVRLPDGALPVARYKRSYAWLGDHTVIAIYEDFRGDGPERRWVEPTNLPLIYDGGCSVVTVFFNLQSGKIDARCNQNVGANMGRNH
jgi:hypothetical protein